MLQALEELALNYDRKVQIAEEKTKELIQVTDDLSVKTVSSLNAMFLMFQCFYISSS